MRTTILLVMLISTPGFAVRMSNASAPGSVKVWPTVTLLIMPVDPDGVLNSWPEPRMVIVGGVVSGTLSAARACCAAALAGGGGEALVLDVGLVLPAAKRLDRAAVAALHFPFTEHTSVVLHVCSAALEMVQGSITKSVRVMLATLPALSEAE